MISLSMNWWYRAREHFEEQRTNETATTLNLKQLAKNCFYPPTSQFLLMLSIFFPQITITHLSMHRDHRKPEWNGKDEAAVGATCPADVLPPALAPLACLPINTCCCCSDHLPLLFLHHRMLRLLQPLLPQTRSFNKPQFSPDLIWCKTCVSVSGLIRNDFYWATGEFTGKN